MVAQRARSVAWWCSSASLHCRRRGGNRHDQPDLLVYAQEERPERYPSRSLRLSSLRYFAPSRFRMMLHLDLFAASVVALSASAGIFSELRLIAR
jgi:hypothetical protein